MLPWYQCIVRHENVVFQKEGFGTVAVVCTSPVKGFTWLET